MFGADEPSSNSYPFGLVKIVPAPDSESLFHPPHLSKVMTGAL